MILKPEDIEEKFVRSRGKGGQNVRLAAKLTGWRIDIKGDGKTVEKEVEAK